MTDTDQDEEAATDEAADAEGTDAEGVTGLVRAQVAEVRGSAENALEGLNERARSALDEAVAAADRESLQSHVDSLGREAIEALSQVLDIVEEHLQDNDIDVEISGHRIRIEGDEDGLKKIETELREAEFLKHRDVDVRYDREDGIDVTLAGDEGDGDAGTGDA